MTREFKWSPLCSRHQGREVYFTARTEARKLSVVFPEEFLDQVCGRTADEGARKSWVKAQREELRDAIAFAKPTPPDLSHVLIEEIS